MNSKLAYRREIDGLRALAVIPVMLFHAGYDLFAGGYVGVDVFFVISGYLITGILLRELAAGDFSIGRFYERRARRILPALLLVIAATVPFAWAWMTEPLYADFSQSLLAVLAFGSNILFWQQSSYFDVAAELKPMLHTWSLAIEEQFYIIFPPLLWLLFRKCGARLAVVMLALVAVLSLIATELFVRHSPIAVFYLLPFRAWELLAGAFCAILHFYNPRSENQSIALIGIGMILVASFLFDASTPFPSMYALLPVGGTVLVVLFGSERGIVGWLLANKYLVGIGLISYSAYLWHQPIFALARIRFDLVHGELVFLALIALTLLIAWLSWRFVEQPFRRGFSFRALVQTMGGASALVAIIGLLGAIEYRSGYSRLVPIIYTDQLINTEIEQVRTWTTVLENESLQNELSQFSETEAVKILLVGDSHAKDLFNALYLTDGDPEIDVRRIPLGGACTNRLNARFEAATPEECFNTLQARAGNLLKQADIVIFTKRWVIDENFEAYLPVFIDRAENLGKIVAIGGNTVEFAPEPPLILRNAAKTGAMDAEEISIRLAKSIRPAVADANQALREISTAKGVPFLDKSSYLCGNAQRTCPALTPQGHAVYFDYGHLTIEGAKQAGETIRASGWLDPVLDQTTGNER